MPRSAPTSKFLENRVDHPIPGMIVNWLFWNFRSGELGSTEKEPNATRPNTWNWGANGRGIRALPESP